MMTVICNAYREQIDRENALSDFTSGDVRVLLATDVASRGLDVKVIITWHDPPQPLLHNPPSPSSLGYHSCAEL